MGACARRVYSDQGPRMTIALVARWSDPNTDYNAADYLI